MPVDAYKKEVGMMRLDNLIAERESVSMAVFTIPVEELLSRYEQLYTGAISDVLREYCLLDQSLPVYMLARASSRSRKRVGISEVPDCVNLMWRWLGVLS